VSGQSTTEGQTSQKTVTVTVGLTGNDTKREVRVDYATADGTATAGEDYTTTSGTLVFPAGTRSLTFDLVVKGDQAPEADETIKVVLSNPVAVTLSDPPYGFFTIENDDTTLAVDDPDPVTEGDSGDAPTVDVTVRIARSPRPT
jgi:hypothetical protein